MIKSILPNSSNTAYTTKNRHVTENTALTKTCNFISNISSTIYFQLYVHLLYVQVTMHRDNLRINNQQDASSIQNFILSWNSICFGHLLCLSSGVISCTRGNQYVSCRLCGRCLGRSRCPKHVEFRDKIKFWILDASCWLFIWRLFSTV
jgi:hypothetical protein